MEGFFSKKEMSSTSRPDGKTYSCVSCGLLKACKTGKLKPTGNFKKGILNVFAVPTHIEDKAGVGFKNKSARLLSNTYKKQGIDLQEDCLNTYAVVCATNKAPTAYQIDCCRKTLLKLIETKKPKVVVLFGDIPLVSLIGLRWKKDLGTIVKWRGWKIPDQDLQTWVLPVFSPEYVLDAKSKAAEVIWENDLKKVSEQIKTPLYKYVEPEIIYLEDDLSILDTIQIGNVAFDYETTGLKPHAKGHRIICASVAVDKDTVYSFMMPASKDKRKPFTDLLQRQKVGKIAQNMKYEDTWSIVKLRIAVVNWLWDTMLATHIIDNRRGVTGLKFQTYVQFGIIDYDSEVSPYFKSKVDKDANGINRIEELVQKPNGEHLLLKYCAYDSIYEYRLAEQQRKHMAGTQGLTPISPINSDYPNAYRLLHEGILALAKAERQGLRIDVEYAEKMQSRLTKKIGIIEKKFFSSKFFKHWQHTSKRKVNLNSGDSLGNFLYNIKKIEPLNTTQGGKGSTDEESLRLLKIPELDLLLERSKLRKIRDTYLKAFVREQVKGVMHPFFNLHFAVTYRSSSSNPNFQNIPKRDKQAMKIIRKAIYPRPGNQLLEIDYKGIEVGISACVHEDPNLIKYVTDPTTDMHGDTAKEIFKIDRWDRSRADHSVLRAGAKNGFVFPQFYGDYYRNNAISLCSTWTELPQTRWKSGLGTALESGGTIGDHLIRKGIKSFDDFCMHIQKIENAFWNKRFRRYGQWKKDHYKEYLKNGYITLKTGFTCGGVLSKNEASNYPVQGPAFHCLLWVFTELSKRFEEGGFLTKLVGQIHDAIVFDVYPPELIEVYNIIQEVSTGALLKKFTWIIVPLSIDAELCPVDGSWAEKKEWKPDSKAKQAFRKSLRKHINSSEEWDFNEDDIPF